MRWNLGSYHGLSNLSHVLEICMHEIQGGVLGYGSLKQLPKVFSQFVLDKVYI